MKIFMATLAVALALVGCGVRGEPQPPANFTQQQ
jgi:predicted small lipoprotein YifL